MAVNFKVVSMNLYYVDFGVSPDLVELDHVRRMASAVATLSRPNPNPVDLTASTFPEL